MNMEFPLRGMLCALFLFASAGITIAEEASTQAVQDMLERHPGLRFFAAEDTVRSFYGRTMATGNSPIASAESFRLGEAAAFDVTPQQLRPESPLQDKRHTQPLMYNRATGAYKFTAVYYSQYLDDIPVFRSDMRLLVRNEADYPVVMAKSYLKPLGEFQTDGIVAVQAFDRAKANARRLFPELADATFTEPVTNIWAGYDEILTPQLAIVFEGIDRSVPASRLFVASAESGAVLYEENRIHDADVHGTVGGIATEGLAADICENHSYLGMPYALVEVVGGASTYADEFGEFVIPHGGTSPVTVRSEVRGQWFRVFSQQGAESVLELNVTPPGPVDIIHNGFNNEIARAQVDAYIHQNIVRDYLLEVNPAYPVIGDEEEFEVIVNKTGGICPNNAQYIASDPSTNYCLAVGNGPNMAWSSVVYHEYGHHIVEVGGSGQCAYGEGMADSIGILVTDESETGYGFMGDCNNPLRDGDNSCQYSAVTCTTNCGGPCHSCGRLLSGCVWSTRNYLQQTHPATYREIISDLTLNSVPLHSGSSITPQITIDFLMLDDDDADLDNGSPHYAQICNGFNDHNMQCPELPLPIINTQPTDTTVCAGDNVGLRVSSDPSFAYQWYKDGNAIPGANGQIHVIQDVQNVDEGVYFCEVINEVGSTPSSSAELVVVTNAECGDGDDCTLDTCSDGQCESSFAAPDSIAMGGRAISLTPQACNEPVAVLVTSDDLPCLPTYLDTDGTLADLPVFQDPSAWETVVLVDEGIIPGTSYTIQAETQSGQFSQSMQVTTWDWGDVNDNQVSNFEDILLIVQVFQGDTSGATVAAVDLEPCQPNALVNLADVQWGVQAFQQQPYAATGCEPCP